MRQLIQFMFFSTLILAPASFFGNPAPQSAPNISVSASLSPDKMKRGSTARATVVMEIPSGFHVNSARPLEKFLIATQLKFDAPSGLRLTPVSYPRAVKRNFKFSKNRVSVYEGKAVMRFNVTVPANFATGSTELRGRLRYQSCNNEVCFPPQTRDVSLWLNVQ